MIVYKAKFAPTDGSVMICRMCKKDISLNMGDQYFQDLEGFMNCYPCVEKLLEVHLISGVDVTIDDEVCIEEGKEMKVIDEERRGTGRTLRLIFRALSYAGERESVQIICGDSQSANVYFGTLIDIAEAYHFPDIERFKDNSSIIRVSGTVYDFIPLRQFPSMPGSERGATILIDHYALEKMEEGRKLKSRKAFNENSPLS